MNAKVIEPAITNAGWAWEAQLRIAPGRISITTGESMYDNTRAIVADYILRYRGIPLAILEVKAESAIAAGASETA